MLKRLAIILVPLAMPAFADTPMSAAEFDAYVTGKTLYYSHLGLEYGVEQYLPGRRVRWAFLDGECRDGVWYQQSDMICFDYEDGIETQCWRFFEQTGGIRAEFANSDTEIELYEAAESDDPMYCKGPEIGV